MACKVICDLNYVLALYVYIIILIATLLVSIKREL